MTDQTTIKIEVSDTDVAREVAYAILRRANDIHNNPDDEHEDTAEELRNIGQELLQKYE